MTDKNKVLLDFLETRELQILDDMIHGYPLIKGRSNAHVLLLVPVDKQQAPWVLVPHGRRRWGIYPIPTGGVELRRTGHLLGIIDIRGCWHILIL